MNLKTIFLLCFVTILIIPDADAWFGRRRRRWRFRPVARLVCGTSCKIQSCQYTRIHNKLHKKCHKTCSRVCRKVFGKREAGESLGMNQDEPALPRKPYFDDKFTVRVPSRLSFYDANKDGRISRAEFMANQPRKTDKISTAKTFDAMDTNGDHYIDCKEFLNAKLQYEAKPKC